MAILIDGKELAKKTRQNLKLECDEIKKEGINPKLAVIMVGDNPASKVYVKNKSKACQEVGIEYEEYLLDSNIKQEELIKLIKKLNEDKTINKQDIKALQDRSTEIETDIVDIQEDIITLQNKNTEQDNKITENTDALTKANERIAELEATVAQQDEQIPKRKRRRREHNANR